MNKDKKNNIIGKKLILSTAAYSLLASLSAALIIFTVLIYVFNMDNKPTRRMAELLPFPAAIVGNDIITIKELNRRLDPIKKFYAAVDPSSEEKVAFSTADGQKILKIKEKYLLNKLIEDAIIEKEAIGRGVKITPEMLSQEASQELKQYGDEKEVQKSLNDLYGWSVSDFQEYVTRSYLYEKGLLENLKNTDDSYKNSREKIEKALSELKEGTDFRSVAKKYSEGASGENEGDLGWFSVEELLPEISAVAFNLDKGKTSEIIESSLGYHIVKIEDKKNENGEDKVRLRQVFTKTKTISDWLSEYEKNIKIHIPLKDFYWNQDEEKVDFSDENFKKFEEDLGKNYPGSISVAF